MERERITISIKKAILNDIDKIIDGINIRNRSHAFETLALQAMKKYEKNKAIVMLGGDDALKNIESTKYFLKQIQKSGIREATIAVGFLGNKVKDKLGSGSDQGITLEYINSDQGSGSALLSIRNKLNQTFIVYNSNKIFRQFDLDKMQNFHKSHNSIATIGISDFNDLRGIYLFEPEIFQYIPDGFSLLEENVFPKLLHEGRLLLYPLA